MTFRMMADAIYASITFSAARVTACTGFTLADPGQQAGSVNVGQRGNCFAAIIIIGYHHGFCAGSVAVSLSAWTTVRIERLFGYFIKVLWQAVSLDIFGIGCGQRGKGGIVRHTLAVLAYLAQDTCVGRTWAEFLITCEVTVIVLSGREQGDAIRSVKDTYSGAITAVSVNRGIDATNDVAGFVIGAVVNAVGGMAAFGVHAHDRLEAFPEVWDTLEIFAEKWERLWFEYAVFAFTIFSFCSEGRFCIPLRIRILALPGFP